MAAIVFDKVSKYYDGVPIIEGLDLEVWDRELLVLVGPSGCGKSTLLRMLAGLEAVSGGEIRIDGKRVNELPPQQRKLAMVFQNYALYPHMTVRRNLAFPLRMQRLSRNEIESRVARAAELLDLVPVLERKPSQLSGGQRQRVAMGRAIVRDADLFLMDEPISNLDAKLRVQIRSEIAALQSRLGTTTLYVTHDQVEAMTLGQRVAVMRGGRLQQVADPQTLYRRPANLFVAGFIGNPGMNLFRAPLVRAESGLSIQVGDNSLPLPANVLERHPGISNRDSQELVVGIRPEAIEPGSDTCRELLPARVRMIESLGHETLVHADCGLAMLNADGDSLREKKAAPAPPLTVVLPGHHPLKPGDTLHLRLNSEAFCLFDLNGQIVG